MLREHTLAQHPKKRMMKIATPRRTHYVIASAKLR
jgi:hypothetical protein